MKDPKAIAKCWARYEANPDQYYGLKYVIFDETPVMATWTGKQITRFLKLHAREYEKVFRKALARAKKDITQSKKDAED